MTSEDDLTDPRVRRGVLRTITPATAREHHALLRVLLGHEVEYRRRDDDAERDDDGDLHENLYRVAFLLFCVGDPADTPALYRAKHTNMDTGVGLDVQCLVGAGTEATLAYLRAHGHAEMADRLAAYPEVHEDLDRWAADMRASFSEEDDVAR